MSAQAFSFECAGCGEVHEGIPHFHSEAPAPYEALSPEEREQAELTSDLCMIERAERTEFFQRGLIEIPVHGYDEPFAWGVWVSLSEESFRRTAERWEAEGREHDPPCFGWLVTALPCYPDTLLLKTMVHSRPVGSRPLIDLEPTDHPLAVEQHQGITPERLREIVQQVLHP